MKYKVGDIVEFDDYVQKGVGKVVAVREKGFQPYLVYSKDLTFGHDASLSKFIQDNDNNWWFNEDELKLLEKFVHNWWFNEELKLVETSDKGKQVNSKDELIKELTEIYNELTEIPELKHAYAISMKVVTKALLHLLRDTKKEPKFTLQCPITGFYFNNINIWTHPNEYKERMNGNYTEETKNRCHFTQDEIDRLPNQEFIKLLNKKEVNK